MKRCISLILILFLLIPAGAALAEEWICPGCGETNHENFCTSCGTKKPDSWVCPGCGRENTTAFCGNCGTAKPVAEPGDQDDFFFRGLKETEVPLALDTGVRDTADSETMKITAVTLPGAFVEVASPYDDLDLTDLETTGKFTFNAVFDHIGDNTITVNASCPGWKQSRIDFVVYYVPPADVYTMKAWPLGDEGYRELLSNIEVRAARNQVYVVKGTVQYNISEDPQIAVINSGEDGESLPVVLENRTGKQWDVGGNYRIYADVNSVYNGMPWLIARYGYEENAQSGVLNASGTEPVFTVQPGIYYATQYVQILGPEGTEVYYTTDGSEPTRESLAYHGETLEIAFTTVIRAKAFASGSDASGSTVTGTYFINAYHVLPLVSIVVDPRDLWDREWGMLTVGDQVVKEPGKLPFKNTVYRKVKDAGIQYESHVEMYDETGSLLISQSADISLDGNFSLDMPQKSFVLQADSKYGADTFSASLFADRDYTVYKGFILRNSGNDCMWTRLQDGFQSRLMDFCGSTVAHQAWKPYAVYLNGFYWGHMNLRETADQFMVAQHEGLPLDEANGIDLLRANGAVVSGTNREYKAMIKKIKAGNPAGNPDDLQYILDNVDVDNYFEYIAFEMFFGNSDIGHIHFYHVKTPGSKWKWLVTDLDYGLYNSNFNSPKSFTKEKGMGEKNIDNTIFVKLLSVPEYRDRFLTIYGAIFQKLTTRNMLAVLEELVEMIEPEMTLHWARWGEENDKFVITEVPTTADGAYRYWEKRVDRLRNVIRKRPTLLWEMTQGAFSLSDEEMVEYFGEKPEFPPDAI